MKRFAIVGITALMIAAVFLVSGYHATTGMQMRTTSTMGKFKCSDAYGTSGVGYSSAKCPSGTQLTGGSCGGTGPSASYSSATISQYLPGHYDCIGFPAANGTLPTLAARAVCCSVN